MRGISKLREHNIPLSVITVLTRDSLNAADELWNRNSSTTLRYYVHSMPDLQQEHVGRLAERLMGRRGGTDGGLGGVR